MSEPLAARPLSDEEPDSSEEDDEEVEEEEPLPATPLSDWPARGDGGGPPSPSENGSPNPPRGRARCGGGGGGGAAHESKTALRTLSSAGAFPSKRWHSFAVIPGTAFCGHRRSKA